MARKEREWRSVPTTPAARGTQLTADCELLRIAQLVVLPVPELDPVEMVELPETERGVRGFGSSKT